MKWIKIALAISSRVDENDVNRTGKYKYILKELTRPFELSIEHIKVDYQPAFAFYGMGYNASESNIAPGVRSYLAFLDEL
jgi:putative NADPH-quinone reductase